VVKAGGRDSVASIARRYKLNPANVAEWNDVNPNHSFQKGFNVVVYLPVKAARSVSVGAGTSRLRGAVPLKSTSVPSKNVTKVSKSSSSQVAREPRGGTPSKKKR
jgi:membrane-bound lytic murein transglycosylase D